jgi:hypothetical protein
MEETMKTTIQKLTVAMLGLTICGTALADDLTMSVTPADPVSLMTFASDLASTTIAPSGNGTASVSTTGGSATVGNYSIDMRGTGGNISVQGTPVAGLILGASKAALVNVKFRTSAPADITITANAANDSDACTVSSPTVTFLSTATASDRCIVNFPSSTALNNTASMLGTFAVADSAVPGTAYTADLTYYFIYTP